MKTYQRPQIILIDGITGAGKSSLLTYIRETYADRIVVGRKFTTRRKRIGDNDWEFQFVEGIPDEYTEYSFTCLGNQYGIRIDEIVHATDDGLIYTVICGDRRIIELLASAFKTIVLYLYRPWSIADLELLLASRGESNNPNSQLRRQEIISIVSKYLENIELYDHVLMNLGSKIELIDQLDKILLLYGIKQKPVI